MGATESGQIHVGRSAELASRAVAQGCDDYRRDERGGLYILAAGGGRRAMKAAGGGGGNRAGVRTAVKQMSFGASWMRRRRRRWRFGGWLG
jgi:hypothetical protein